MRRTERVFLPNGARERLLLSWEQSSPEEDEVHPGAGLWKRFLIVPVPVFDVRTDSTRIRRRALNALS